MHQDNGRDLPDLQLFGGVSVGFAVSAEHLVVVRQLLFLGEQLQTVLLGSNKALIHKTQNCLHAHFDQQGSLLPSDSFYIYI